MIFSQEFYALSGLVNMVTSMSLGVLLLLKSSRIAANRYFAYFCFAVGFWSLFYYQWQSTTDLIWAEFYLRTCMLSVFLMPALFLHFVFEFLKLDTPKWLIRFNYVFAVAGMSIAYTPLYAYDMQPFLNMLWLKAGPVFLVILLHFAAIMLYGIYLLRREYHRAKGLHRTQIQYVFWGMVVAVANGSVNYLDWYRIPVPPATNILVSGYVILITYAILKHQLLDITLVVKKSVVYSALVSLIMLFYFVMIYLVENWIKGFIGYQSLVASFATAIAVAIFFIPMRGFLQSLVDRHLFKASYAQMIEQNERLRREMVQIERYKSFASLMKSVAYAFKDPLTAIKTYTHYVPQRLEDKEFLNKMAGVMSREVGKIDELVTQLIRYSEPPPLHKQKTNVIDQIQEAVLTLHSDFTRSKVTVYKMYEPEQFQMMTLDQDQIRQALIHLMQHAVMQMPDGGQMWISTEEAENFFIIRLKDTGRGIPKSQLTRIFDPFFRFQESSHGMGLSIAFSIIESHNGHIKVESEEDVGTEFSVQLPILE